MSRHDAAPDDAVARLESEPTPHDQAPVGEVIRTLEALRHQVASLPLPLATADVVQARIERDRLLRQFDDYLLPRLMRRDAPLLTVIGGSTGAGKSTLTNSLVRREVSRSGVLRPTTRSPVLVHHVADSGVFLSHRILPGLTRVTQEGPEPAQPIDPSAPRITAVRLVPHRGMPAGMALLDAPDIDSLVGTNRDLAVQLLDAADLWLFVTTAARYADAAPWRLLDEAGRRGIAVAVVLDRVPPEAIDDLRSHLAMRLVQSGLPDTPVFTIPETTLVDGFLPEAIVAPLWAWLQRIATDPHARGVVVDRTLSGVLRSLPERAGLLADAVEAQVETQSMLRNGLDAAYQASIEGVAERLGDGSVLRGDVLARWPQFLGAQGRINPEPMLESLHASIVAAVTAEAREAAEDVVARWREHPAGVQLLDGEVTALVEPSADLVRQMHEAVAAWLDYVVHTVQRRKPSRRARAAVETIGPRNAAVVLIFSAFEGPSGMPHSAVIDDLAVFPGYVASPPADVADRRAVILAARASQSRRRARDDRPELDVIDDATLADVASELRDAVFGVRDVRPLAVGVREDLLARVEAVLAVERARFIAVLGRADVRPGRGQALRDAARDVAVAVDAR